jgi:four helix bundle protein
MREGIRNPKSEGRRPKESRRLKSEHWMGDEVAGGESEFWGWRAEAESATMVLREEEGAGKTAPRDLKERTARFGESIIRLSKRIPQNPVNSRLIGQLVGAGTSVGANYCEADDAVSGKEFKLKIGTCRKESKEVMFFLRMVATAEESLASEARVLWREAKELNLIFGAIWRK